MMRPYLAGAAPRYAACHDPMTIALVGVSALGTLTTAGAQMQQGQVAQQMASYNNIILNQRADQAQAEARARADIQARDSARRLGATRAAYGASGVDVNTGTPLEVMADEATEGELQRRLTLYQGDAQAYNLRQQGMLALAGGGAAANAADTAAGTTLLTGAARTGFTAYQLGAFSGGGTIPYGTNPKTGAVNY